MNRLLNYERNALINIKFIFCATCPKLSAIKYSPRVPEGLKIRQDTLFFYSLKDCKHFYSDGQGVHVNSHVQARHHQTIDTKKPSTFRYWVF